MTMVFVESSPPEADFDVVITAESVERKKPAPDPYLKAVEMLGLRKE